LHLRHDVMLWWRITGMDNQINAEIRRLEPFVDEKSVRLTQLRTGHEVLERLLTFMTKHGLGPTEIGAGDDEVDMLPAISG